MIPAKSPTGTDVVEKFARPVAGLAELPAELLYMITGLLAPTDVFHCRLLCRTCFQKFTTPSLLKRTLIAHYPEAREIRSLRAISATDTDHAWTIAFDRVLARYSALKAARPRSVTNLKLVPQPHLWGPLNPNNSLEGHFTLVQHPIPRWDRYYNISLPQQPRSRLTTPRPPCEPKERFWTCDDSGLLVYYNPKHKSFVLCDLNSPKNSETLVPFPCQGRIVRRLRIKAELLIIEWAEDEPYHQLNDTEAVHRHFVTAFDVKSVPHDGADYLRKDYKAEIRNEWKLHFLGFPLKSQDLWLSVHTNTHYAAYIWQPNRSAWGEDEPIESLSVWDISEKSDYRPSMDPFGSATPLKWPQIVKKFPFTSLGHWTIRQRDAPVLRRLELDAGMVYFCEGRSSNESGAHAGLHPLDIYLSQPGTNMQGAWTRKVGIPIIGFGPPWQSLKCSDIPEVGRQMFQDEVAGIRYDMITNQIPHLFLLHKDWRSSLNLGYYSCSPELSIYADEHRIVMQCGKEDLKILHFDHRPGAKGFALHQSLIATKPRRPSPLSSSNYLSKSPSR